MMTMIYKFKTGAHLSGDAQAVGERLAALEVVGRLTPKTVVDDARSDASPLHALFEWDDAKAAELHRLTQAGHVLRCVTVMVDPQEASPKEIRAFVPITSGDDETRHYVGTVRALSDEEMRRQVLAQAHAELGAVARKYRELKELSEVVHAIDRVGELLLSSKGQIA